MKSELFSVILLAGGSSKRMGEDKRLLKLGNLTLVERLITLLAPLTDDLLISSNDMLKVFNGLKVIPDLDPGSGPLTGMISAMKEIKHPQVLLVSCDMPFITQDMLRPIMNSSNETYAIFTYQDRLQPFPGLYQRTILPLLERHFESGQRSLYSFFRKTPGKVLLYECENADTIFLNLNRPKEYDTALSIFKNTNNKK